MEEKIKAKVTKEDIREVFKHYDDQKKYQKMVNETFKKFTAYIDASGEKVDDLEVGTRFAKMLNDGHEEMLSGKSSAETNNELNDNNISQKLTPIFSDLSKTEKRVSQVFDYSIATQFDPDEADLLGAFSEDALSEEDISEDEKHLFFMGGV